jgi:peroxiredoxin
VDFSAFKMADAEVFGVSVDSVWTHLAFKKSLGVDYDLLADFNPKGAVAKQFGLYKEEAGITSRATVVVDKAGKVAFVHEEALGEGRDNKKILEALSKL